MGKTLFWYLLRDLLRIFVLASIVISGIMSFAGLLRPMTQLGLDPVRLGLMWFYSMPAMMTYSMPISAVFAASVVYGRLAADNEMTACRAAGLSYSAIAGPGVALGMVASLTSLLFLSYVVPYFFLKAERIGKANVAKVIAASIERTHSFSPSKGGNPIFAQQATIPASNDGEQMVILSQPTIIETMRDPYEPALRIPKKFNIAESATLYIQQDDENEIRIWGVLKGATTFSRSIGTEPQGGVEQQEFGPITMPSPVQQNVKFMNISRLKRMLNTPEKTSRVRNTLAQFIQSDQRKAYLSQLASTIGRDPQGLFRFAAAEDYRLYARTAKVTMVDASKTMRLTAGPEPIRLTRPQGGGRLRIYEAKAMEITPEMDNLENRVLVKLDLEGVQVIDAEQRIDRSGDTQVVSVEMPENVRKLQSRKVGDYLQGDWIQDRDKRYLKHRVIAATGEIMAEIHSRTAFALSCLVLVMVGTYLGMLLKSGDFLSAFAVSVIPALLTITLVVAGTQMSTEVTPNLQSRLPVGLVLIWGGNILSAILAAWLLNRLRKA